MGFALVGWHRKAVPMGESLSVLELAISGRGSLSQPAWYQDVQASQNIENKKHD